MTIKAPSSGKYLAASPSKFWTQIKLLMTKWFSLCKMSDMKV